MVPIACQSEGALEVYIEPVLPAPHLVVVGRSPMAHTLADLARALGWRAALIDGPDFTAAHASERSMVVVATQGHFDEEAVEQAVAARPAYLGLVGSERRGRGAARLPGRARRARRTSSTGSACPPGWTWARPRTRRSPSRSWPSWSSCARPAPWRAGRRPRTAARPGPAADRYGQAVDPVCGMTVTADASGRPLEHDGVTYYFCCGGCRRAFEHDPAAHLKRETRC